ncbi:MAG: GatB/YqeY domain-containing protein [Bacteriovoracaceae bacterium]|nr:GatB/YqeY domain-containing protein [Bacteriovoracaceae bacterium]
MTETVSIQAKVNQEITQAMKDKNKERLEALRFLKSLFIHNNTSGKPTDDLSVVVNHVKKLNDSLAAYPVGSEHALKIQAELKVMAEYLPKAMEESEVINLVKEFMKSNPSAQLGDAMKFVTPQIKGKFDGKRASEIVKSLIN